jgi:hypothetical protein
MTNANAVLTVFNSPLEIAAAIRQVKDTGFGTNGISVAWTDQTSQSIVTGYYKDKHQMKYWGDLDSQWNELFQILAGWALFSIPSLGRVLIVGPLAGWTATAMANAAIFGDMSAIGMGLYSIGISRKNIQSCEEALTEGKCVVLLNGPAQEVKKVKQIIDEFCAPTQTDLRKTMIG